MAVLIGGESLRMYLALGQSWLSPNPDTSPVDWTTMTWTEITSYVVSGKISRGRQRPVDDWQSATCELLLNNKDGRFDPRVLDGPYADGDGISQCRLDTPIKVETVSLNFGGGGTVYSRFAGLTGVFPVSREKRAAAWVTLKSWDMLSFVNRFPFSGKLPRESVKNRMWRLLDYVGWPAASVSSPYYRRTYGTDVGTECAPAYVVGSTVGAEMLRALRTEGPNAYAHFDRTGAFTLAFRNTIFSGSYPTPVAEFSTAERDKRFASVVWSPDSQDYYNQVSIAFLTTTSTPVTLTCTGTTPVLGDGFVGVEAIEGAVPIDEQVDFGLARVATLSAAARAGDDAIYVDALDSDIPVGSVAVYSPSTVIKADNAEQAIHGKRVAPAREICSDDVDFAHAMAEDIMSVSTDSAPRILSIQVDGRRSQTNAEAIIADIVLLSTITITDVPDYATLAPAVGQTVESVDMVVQGYTDTFSLGQWQTDYYVSPRPAKTYSLLDDAATCTLGTTATAGF